MYEALSARVGVVHGGTNIGVVRIDDARVLLIDTGLNDTTARKVLRAVKDTLGSEVAGIVTTHAHADHFGAHRFVTRRTGAVVFAPDLEENIIRHPLLQPILLFGGADPVDALKSRFLPAESCCVDHILNYGTQTIMGVSVEAIPLPGHSPNQLGFLIDGIFFCADVVFPEVAIEKYRLPYLFGLTDHLASLGVARSVSCSTVVPGHGPKAESIEQLYYLNVSVIEHALSTITEIVEEPKSTDQICTELFRRLEVPVTDAQGYYLLHPTVLAYLSHLERMNVISLVVEEKAAFWHAR